MNFRSLSASILIIFATATLAARTAQEEPPTINSPQQMQQTPPPDEGPDFSNPNSKIPLPDIDANILYGLAKPQTKSKVREVSAQSLQKCDPTIPMQFYNAEKKNLCIQNKGRAFCGFSLGDYLADNLRTEEMIGIMFGQSASAQYTAFKEIQKGVKSTNEVAIGGIKERISKALHELPDSEEKRILEKSLSEKDIKLFKQMLTQIEKSPSLTPELVGAISSIPDSAVGGKVFLTLLKSALITGALSGTMMIINGGPMVVTPTNQSLCHEDTQFGDGEYESLDQYCRVQFHLDQYVFKFLALSYDEQMQKLNRDPLLCDYYSKFNQYIRNAAPPLPQLSQIQCKADGFSYNVGSPASAQIQLTLGDNSSFKNLIYTRLPLRPATKNSIDKFEVHFVNDGSDQVVNSVSFNKLGEQKPTKLSYDLLAEGPAYRNIGFDSEGWSTESFLVRNSSISNTWRKSIIKTIANNSVVAEPIRSCCEIKDGSLREKCVSAIENPTAKNVWQLLSQTSALQKNQSTHPNSTNK